MNRPSMDRELSAKADGARHPVRVAVALAIGAILYLALPTGPGGGGRGVAWRWVFAVAAAAIAVVPPVHQSITFAIARVRNPSDRARWITAVVVTVASAGYFILTALNQGRDFFAKTHDECAYLIQTQMLARGRLWMPAHPLADFFDTFYVLTTPKYVPITFPGSSMFFVASLWLHLPTWLVPVAIAGAIVGLTYRIVAEMTDGAGGLLAAAIVVSLSWFRMLSIMLMSQLPVLLLGLVMLWAFLRYHRAATGLRGRWLCVIGACSGWAAITRPVDALILTVPVGLGLLLDLRRASWRTRVGSLAIVVAAAIPFLAIQATINRGVTGHFSETPAKINLDRDTPGGAYGFHALERRSQVKSVVRQKQIDYDQWAVPFIVAHRPELLLKTWWKRRLPIIADATLPARPLLILFPIGLLGLRGRRLLLFATLPLFVLGYVGWAFFLEHYTLVIVPAVALLVVLAVREVGLVRPELASAAVAFTLALAVTGCWELNHAVDDEPFRATWLRELHNATESDAIILFTFDLDPASPDVIRQISQEPVYNTDVAWPDDARLIRAHDLGPRNVELFRYYAAREPARRVYRFSRRTGMVEELGRVGDLAGR